MSKEVKRTVSMICNSDCIAPFECERKKWQDQNEQMACAQPRFGKGEECPLLQFEAEEDKDKRPFWEKDSYYRPHTINDTWRVCESCKHTEIKGKTIVIPDEHFSSFCMDCPILMIRDNLCEGMAEIAML